MRGSLVEVLEHGSRYHPATMATRPQKVAAQRKFRFTRVPPDCGIAARIYCAIDKDAAKE